MTALEYSPGLEGVVAGETSICSVDEGLQYRGFSIEDLAQHASFEETAFLLLHGNLPTHNELSSFRARLGASIAVPDALLDILELIPDTAPMMDVMRTGCSLLSHWDPDLGENRHEANIRKAERLVAQLPVVLAARHRLRRGEDIIPPDPNLSLAANLLYMLRDEIPSDEAQRALDVSLIVYAEQEFNASTFTARVVASTLSDVHSAVTAAISALKGPLHGGANEHVMNVLTEVGAPQRADAWVREQFAKRRRIMGFGHRVYKQGDPRARLLKPLCATLAGQTGNAEIEAVAESVEQAVAATKRGLPPNVDWPTGRLYHYLGLPTDLYTPLFVVARVAGWSAHVIEQLDNNRIIRPRARYTGPTGRAWAPMSER
ncbi:MAG: citrate synthase [Planctomycetales bacterium]|nr:citrate synthase [Planctomycetales bacterium]